MAEKFPKVLIIGIDSKIGSHLYGQCRERGAKVRGTSRNKSHIEEFDYVYLDLRSTPDCWELPNLDVDVAVICAGITSGEYCEEHPEDSRLVNVTHTLALASMLSSQGARIIYLSSDRVFSGEIKFPDIYTEVSPRTEYGKQKAEVERELLSSFQNVNIIRLGKVIHGEMGTFHAWVMDLAQGREIYPFSDLLMSPISLELCSNLLMRIVEIGDETFRLTHCSDERDISYAEAARWLASSLNLDLSLVKPRPAGSVISNLNLAKNVSLAPTHNGLISDLRGAKGIECFRIFLPKT